MKQGNSCGAKGLAVLPLELRTPSPDSEPEQGRGQKEFHNSWRKLWVACWGAVCGKTTRTVL
jgi:hypothetical protein